MRLALVCWVALAAEAQAATQQDCTEPLKLLISVEQQSITSPLPARITLHLHNSGPSPLRLYRRARDRAQEGSSLEVKLEPTGAPQSNETSTPAESRVLDSVGLPHPRLVRLNPDEDSEERAIVQISPALAGSKAEGKPIWGRYRLSVTYSAKYSNAEEIARNTGVIVWQGKVISNTIEIELLPRAAGQGSVAGTILGSDGHSLRDVLVSLSDQQERVVGQIVTDNDGRFSFSQLPLDCYWLAARLANSSTDTVVSRHVELTPTEPAGAMQIIMLSKEIYEAKAMLHKPVLFRVTDAAGNPLGKGTLEITWSNGQVLDSVKGQVFDDGTAALELIPGRNFVTLKRRGCPKYEERVDVGEGPGIDGFKLSVECARR